MPVKPLRSEDIEDAGFVRIVYAARHRIETRVCKQSLGYRIDYTILWDDAAGKGLAGGQDFRIGAILGIADGTSQAGKVSRTPGCWGYSNRSGAAATLNRSLVIHEEEQLVADDRTAQSPAKDVLAQFRLGLHSQTVIRPALCIERVVPEKFKNVPMKLIGTRLGCRRNSRPCDITELG